MSYKSQNIFWNKGKVTTEQRAQQNGHPGCIVWLTGLSGSGKTTIATELKRELFNLGKRAYVATILCHLNGGPGPSSNNGSAG